MNFQKALLWKVNNCKLNVTNQAHIAVSQNPQELSISGAVE
jgi:hypothetical protein